MTRLERWSDRWETFDRWHVVVLAGFFLAISIVNFAYKDWGEGLAWLVTAIWAGNAYIAKREARRARDAFKMLRELAQMPVGGFAKVETLQEVYQPAGTIVVGKFVGAM